ncbi:MAG TPA: DUF488 family protein [Terrimicrobiaceae bacterium]
MITPKASIYRYGSTRQPHEGLRLGVARHVPRGIKREDWQPLGYFDQWLPLLAPTADLVAQYQQKKITFATFSKRYRSQMKSRDCQQIIDLLAAIALFLPISLGCYCEDEHRCHRSLLQKLIVKQVQGKAKKFALLREHGRAEDILKYSSPVCFQSLEED